MEIANNFSGFQEQQQGSSFCPEDVYSEEQRAYRIYAGTPISLFGIISNVLNIIVFADYEMRQQLVNHFLLALSISDLMLLICNFCFLVLPVVVIETDSFFWNDFFPQIIRYSYPLALTVQTSGVYLTLLVSVHRFLGVCHPFKAKRWVTRAPVESAIAGSILFSFAINIPTWLELSVVPCFSQRFNQTSSQIQLASFHSNNYIIVKKCLSYTVFMFIIPFTALITVNWKMIQALRFSSRMRTQHSCSYSTMKTAPSNENIARQLHLLKKTRYSEVFKTISKISYSSILRPSSDFLKPKFSNSPRDRSITMMLLAIVAMFLVCNGLAFLNSIVESIMIFFFSQESSNSTVELFEQIIEEAALQQNNISATTTAADAVEQWKYSVEKWFEASVELSNVLVTLNSSTSTLVYLIFSSKYRLIFKSLFGLYKREKLNGVALTTAFAARRVMELSLIPEEAECRSRRRNTNATALLSTATTTTSGIGTTTTTVLTSGTPKSAKSVSIVRKEASLDSPASLKLDRREKKKSQKQQLSQKQFSVQFRKQPSSTASTNNNNNNNNNNPQKQQHQQQKYSSLIRESQSSVQLCGPLVNSNKNSSSSSITTLAGQRRAMFRGLQKSSKELFRSTGTLNSCRSLTNSESNLRLMEEQEQQQPIAMTALVPSTAALLSCSSVAEEQGIQQSQQQQQQHDGKNINNNKNGEQQHMIFEL